MNIYKLNETLNVAQWDGSHIDWDEVPDGAKYTPELNPMYGKKHTEETKKLLSEHAKLKTGDKNPFFGKKHTEETRKKMRENHARPTLGKSLSEEHKAKISKGNLGIKRTDEQRRNISESAKKRGSTYKRTPEHNKKMSERIKKWHAERKLNNASKA